MDEILKPETEESTDIILATVTAVSSTGVTIQIDGNDSAGSKEYKCNTAQKFAVGDRVKITPNSGTYIVDHKVGTPMADYPIPAGGSDGQVLTKDGADDYAVKWSAPGTITVTQLENGSYTVQLTVDGELIGDNVTLGTEDNPFAGLYITGDMLLGVSVTSKIGFFGHSPVARKSISNSATVATLISALKGYGLFN